MLPLGLAILAVVTIAAQQPTPVVQSVDLAVPFAPVTIRQAGAAVQLVYELHITNFQQTDITIRAVTIAGDDRRIARYEGDELARRMTRPGFRNDHPTPRLIGPGLRAVVHVWAPLNRPFVKAIVHTVELDLVRGTETVAVAVTGGQASVTQFTSAAELDPPLRGGPWIAIYDPLLKGGHRTAIYTIDGRARIPGRFAIDFIAFPDTGALPAVRAADSNGFGAEVLAVADGTVAIAVDGVADATPPPITLELAPGNHVAIDLGGGRVAFYEHLRQGSVLVKPGQRVTRGQIIARLGSSGSSSIGPHLHFHLADAASPLGAEGLPFVFRQFTYVGRFASLTALLAGEKWQPAVAAEVRQQERPDTNSVIHFP